MELKQKQDFEAFSCWSSTSFLCLFFYNHTFLFLGFSLMGLSVLPWRITTQFPTFCLHRNPSQTWRSLCADPELKSRPLDRMLSYAKNNRYVTEIFRLFFLFCSEFSISSLVLFFISQNIFSQLYAYIIYIAYLLLCEKQDTFIWRLLIIRLFS